MTANAGGTVTVGANTQVTIRAGPAAPASTPTPPGPVLRMTASAGVGFAAVAPTGATAANPTPAEAVMRRTGPGGVGVDAGGRGLALPMTTCVFAPTVGAPPALWPSRGARPSCITVNVTLVSAAAVCVTFVLECTAPRQRSTVAVADLKLGVGRLGLETELVLDDELRSSELS